MDPDGGPSRPHDTRPKIVIIGAGFGGLFCARALRKAPSDVVLIDKQNHHLFQPLLYQVATAGLSPADIAWPVRKVLRGQDNLTVLMDEVTGIDRTAKTVTTHTGVMPYDTLVVAPGSQPSYFGNDPWAAHAPGLKTLDDALEMRRRLLMAFEQAEVSRDADERRRLMTFVIVGGGPTGVELAGNIAELAKFALARDFQNIDPADARIVICDMADRVLMAYPDTLSDYSRKALNDLGVEVLLERRITDVTDTGVTFADGDRIDSASVFWTAGNAASGLLGILGAEQDRGGRVMVSPDLTLPDDAAVFVIGDAAHVADKAGTPLPGVAPVAKQQGGYVGRLITARLKGQSTAKPFRYRSYGNMAVVGRNAAIADFGWLRVKGWLGWWLWGLVHIWFLIGLRSPVSIMIQWLFSYLTYEQGARLITGMDAAQPQRPGRSG